MNIYHICIPFNLKMITRSHTRSTLWLAIIMINVHGPASGNRTIPWSWKIFMVIHWTISVRIFRFIKGHLFVNTLLFVNSFSKNDRSDDFTSVTWTSLSSPKKNALATRSRAKSSCLQSTSRSFGVRICVVVFWTTGYFMPPSFKLHVGPP